MTKTTKVRCPEYFYGYNGSEQCAGPTDHESDHQSFSYGWPNEAADTFTLDRARAAIGEVERRMTALEGRCPSQPEINDAMTVLERGVRTRISELEGDLARLIRRVDLMAPQVASLLSDTCRVYFKDLEGKWQTCNVVSGHIGGHQHMPTPQETAGREATCGALREGGIYDEDPCVLQCGHTDIHRDADGDVFGD